VNAEDGIEDGCVLGFDGGTPDEGKILGLLLGSTDGIEDGSILFTDDGTLEGKIL